MTSTILTTRLLAAIDKREVIARAAIPGPWRWGNWNTEFGATEEERRTLEHAPSRGQFPAVVERDAESTRVLPDLEDPLEYTDEDEVASAAHIVENDPAAVIRMCQAHRELLELHAIVWRDIGWLADGEENYAEIPVCGLCVPKHSHFASRADVPEGPCQTVKTVAEGYGLTIEGGL